MNQDTSRRSALVLPAGETIPRVGQGTWFMAEQPARRAQEIAALQAGIELGMTLIDTAEMYGDGAAERLVGEAIKGRRDDVFLVSKVLPGHASCQGTIQACEASLRRLGTERIDLYLLHWRGGYALRETLEGFQALQLSGKIRYWGVSNFDLEDMIELTGLQGATGVQVNQVLYNLTRRGIEFDLLPWCQKRPIALMAYSPVEQGRLLHHPLLKEIGKERGVTPAQVALSWLLRQDGVMVIPKAASVAHVRENHGALTLDLSPDALERLDQAFPPAGPQPLEML